MGQEGEKKLCWNCDGFVGIQLVDCPYCGVSLTQPDEPTTLPSPAWEQSQEAHSQPDNSLYSVSDQEWNQALDEKESSEDEEEMESVAHKKEMVAFLLLLPGIVFFLFSLALFLFSKDGVLTLQWNQNFAYFYFLGALPLLYLGWRAFR